MSVPFNLASNDGSGPSEPGPSTQLDSQGESERSLEALQDMIELLTIQDRDATALNECMRNGNAAYYSIWNHMTASIFNSKGVKSFSPVHHTESDRTNDCILLAPPPGANYTEGSQDPLEGISIAQASNHVKHTVAGRVQDERPTEAVGMAGITTAAEAYKLIRATLVGIRRGAGVQKLVEIQDITYVVASLRNRVNALAEKRTEGFSASTMCSLKLLSTILRGACNSQKLTILIGQRGELPNNGVSYTKEVCIHCRIGDMRMHGSNLSDKIVEKEQAIYTGLLFNMNCTWHVDGFGTQVLGYVNVVRLGEEQNTRVYPWYRLQARLRRLVSGKTMHDEAEQIAYHREGAITALPFVYRFCAVLYIVIALSMGIGVAAGNAANRSTVFEKMSDGLTTISTLLVTVFGLLKLTSADNNAIRNCLLGKRVLKNSSDVRKYLGLGSEGEVKALLASVAPASSWLESVNICMLDDSRTSGNLRMPELSSIGYMMLYDARIIGNLVEWISGRGDSDIGSRLVIRRRKLVNFETSALLSEMESAEMISCSFHSSNSEVGRRAEMVRTLNRSLLM